MSRNGYGQKLSVTGTASQINFPQSMAKVTVYNSGASDLYCAVDCSLTEFSAIVTAGTYISIASGREYVFDSLQGRAMAGICLQSSSGTLTTYINAY